MANKRMINSSVWTDEKFIESDDVTRLVWFGLITNVDDQGRISNNSALLKAAIFPADRKSTTTLKNSVKKLEDAGMVLCYEKDGKNVIQIIKWWEHQSPAWAAPSSLPAPDNWIDRVKIMSSGRKILMENWESQGGYVLQQVFDYVSEQVSEQVLDNIADTCPTPIATVKIKDKYKIKQQLVLDARARIFKAYENEIGVITPVTAQDITATLEDYQIPGDWIVEAIHEAARNNKRNWKYVAAILKRWKVDGFQSNNKQSGRRPAAERDMGGYQVDKTSETIITDDGEEGNDEVQF